jgi:hypothetical protein
MLVSSGSWQGRAVNTAQVNAVAEQVSLKAGKSKSPSGWRCYIQPQPRITKGPSK